MKSIFKTIITTALLAVGLPCNSETTIADAIAAQMEAYPCSQLADVYKNFFQDSFGPGHLLADTAAARQYLRRELHTAPSFDGPQYEPTGHRGNFYRVNLSLIKDGLVDEDTYFKAFVRSMQGIQMPEPDAWREQWSRIDSVIQAQGLVFPDEAADRAAIDSVLRSDDFAVHHSARFNRNYQLHYRIISRDIFEAEILPLICP